MNSFRGYTIKLDPTETFDVWHAFAEWRARGIEGEELKEILEWDLRRCIKSSHFATATNIQKMLAVLDS